MSMNPSDARPTESESETESLSVSPRNFCLFKKLCGGFLCALRAFEFEHH